MSEQEEDKMCPSSTCHEGAILLGVMQGNDEVALLNYPLSVNADFVERVKQEGSPEKRFRFADTCLKCGCKQWADNKCGVIKELVEVNTHVKEEMLPKCVLRPQCRWYSQEGSKACNICPLVITDNREAFK